MKRMTANLNVRVKANLHTVKETLKFKNENQTVAYLIAHFEASVDKITLKQDAAYREKVEAMMREQQE